MYVQNKKMKLKLKLSVASINSEENAWFSYENF